MTATRILIDPARCRETATELRRAAGAEEALAGELARAAAALPALPSGGVAIGETICSVNISFGQRADDLRAQAKVLELAASIIELDQRIAGAAFGALPIDALFAAVRSGRVDDLRDRMLDALLGDADLTELSQRDWQTVALFRAGIDLAEWRPELGLVANDDIIQAVYTYYGELWLENHDFEWAGMANLVGPMFYAGWQDLHAIAQITDPDERRGALLEMMGLEGFPAWALSVPGMPMSPLDAASELTAENLRWFETRFLEMQQEIFMDLAWQHEMYRYGGLELMRELTDLGELTEDIVRPWELIASGDPDAVARGNRALLRREQLQIIQDDWAAIRGHGFPLGDLFTYVMTWTAGSPFPGAQPYRDVVTQSIGLEIDTPGIGPWDPPDPGAHVTVPRGNIADFNDRWEWISEDMLPAYRELLRDIRELSAIIETPVEQRAREFRKIDVIAYPS